MGSFGSSLSSNSGYGSSGRVIPLAVQSRRSIKYVDVPTYGNYEALTLEIPASRQTLNFRMPTRSSPINIETYHQPSRGSYAETSSVDEPHVRKHTVYRQIHSQVFYMKNKLKLKQTNSILTGQRNYFTLSFTSYRSSASGGACGTGGCSKGLWLKLRWILPQIWWL